MNPNSIRTLQELYNGMNNKLAEKIIAARNSHSENIIKAADSLIEAYKDAKDLNYNEFIEALKLLLAYMYLNKNNKI